MFSSTSIDIIKHAEENARHRLSEIPEVIAGSLRGIVTSNNLQNEQAREDMQERNNRLENRLDTLEGLVKAALFGSKANKRQLAASVADVGESLNKLYPLLIGIPLTTETRSSNYIQCYPTNISAAHSCCSPTHNLLCITAHPCLHL
jgi:hypothetical protein